MKQIKDESVPKLIAILDKRQRELRDIPAGNLPARVEWATELRHIDQLIAELENADPVATPKQFLKDFCDWFEAQEGSNALPSVVPTGYDVTCRAPERATSGYVQTKPVVLQTLQSLVEVVLINAAKHLSETLVEKGGADQRLACKEGIYDVKIRMERVGDME